MRLSHFVFSKEGEKKFRKVRNLNPPRAFLSLTPAKEEFDLSVGPLERLGRKLYLVLSRGR